MIREGNANYLQKTSFANSGRIAGTGINEDYYGDNSEISNVRYRKEPKFTHEIQRKNGEVIIIKGRK